MSIRRTILALAVLSLSGAILAFRVDSTVSAAPPSRSSFVPESSPTSPYPTPTRSPEPGYDVDRGWRTITDLPAGHLGAVAGGDDGWVAVGMLGWPDGQDSSLASPDGIVWRHLTGPTLYERSWHASVTDGPGGWVIVGRSFTDLEPVTTRHEAAAWRSTDLVTWTMAPFVADLDLGCVNLEFPEDSYAGMRDVVDGGPGYVGVGNVCADAAIWTSPEGLSWQRVPDLPGAAGAVVHAVVALDDGSLVAVGQVGTWDDARARVWSSQDGIAWRIEPVPQVGPILIAATDGTIVISSAAPIGSAPGADQPLLVRDPGGTWAGTEPPSLSGVRVAAIASNGSCWVAFGTRNVQSAVLGDAAWISDDGRTWAAASGFDPPFPPGPPGSDWDLGVAAVASDGVGFVAVGAMPGSDPAAGVATAWISPPSAP